MMIRVLGPIDAVGPDGSVNRFEGRQAEALAYLALQAGSYVDKSEIWAEFYDEHVPVGRVDRAIYEIRSKLGKSAIDTNKNLYRLELPTDLMTAELRVKDLQRLMSSGDAEAALDAAGPALELWRGTAFSGVRFQSSVMTAKAEQPDHLRATIMRSVLRAHWLLGDADQVRQIAEKYLIEMPTDDELNRYLLLAVRYASGDEAYRSELIRVAEIYEAEDVYFPRDLGRIDVAFASDIDVFGSLRRSSPAPESGAAGVPLTVAHNLPGAQYAEFVRTDELEVLSEGVNQSLPLIVLWSIPGRGKSALAHRFAWLHVTENTRFNAVVWVSDVEHPGTTTLATVIDRIALVTENSELSKQSDAEQRKRTALRFLGEKSVLLVLDNYETMTDPEIDRWIVDMPPGSKVLITSTHFPRHLERFVFEVAVSEPDDGKRVPFLNQLLNRQRLRVLDPAGDDLKAIWDAAHGNYRLVQLAVAQLGRFELDDILDDIDSGDIGRSVRRGWDSLGDDDRMVLEILACFPYGVSTRTVRKLADGVETPTGSLSDTYLQSLDTLVDLCFVNIEHDKDGFVIDGIVRSWTRSNPTAANDLIRSLWFALAVETSAKVGFHPEDLSRLDVLDRASSRLNLEFALTSAVEDGRWVEALVVSREIRYYYYVRGIWAPNPNVFEIRIEAARALGDPVEELAAVTYLVNIAAKQRNADTAERLLPRLEELLELTQHDIDDEERGQVLHSKALYLHSQKRYAEAIDLWETNLASPELLGDAHLSANLRWYARCLVDSGDPIKRRNALDVLARARTHAAGKYPRAVVLIDLSLLKLRLSEPLDPDELDDILADFEPLSETLTLLRDRRYDAEYSWLLSRAYAAVGNHDAAGQHEHEARETFRSLGMDYPDEENVA